MALVGFLYNYRYKKKNVNYIVYVHCKRQKLLMKIKIIRVEFCSPQLNDRDCLYSFILYKLMDKLEVSHFEGSLYKRIA